MNKKHLFITLLAGLLVVLALVLLPSNDKSVLAQTASGGDGEMRGFAWSSNIGWVSFNSVDLPNSSATYSVKINADNTLEGYAWSSNLGWLRFNPAYVGPTGASDAWGARIEGDKLTGWARFCSVYVSGCSGATKDVNGTELGGWDGWLKMSDVNYDATTGGFSGFAWGSLNVGWLKFGLHPDDPITCPVDLVGDCCPAWQVCGGGGGGGFSVSCSIDSPEGSFVNKPINWTALASGGSGSYEYKWENAGVTNPFEDVVSPLGFVAGQFISDYSLTTRYPSPGNYSVKVTAKDNSGAQAGPVTCLFNGRNGIDILPDCINQGPIPEGGPFYCCDDLETQREVGYNCDPSLDACTVERTDDDYGIEILIDGTPNFNGSYLSHVNQPITLSGDCSGDFNSTGVPPGVNLVCSSDRGQNWSVCAQLAQGNYLVGAYTNDTTLRNCYDIGLSVSGVNVDSEICFSNTIQQ